MAYSELWDYFFKDDFQTIRMGWPAGIFACDEKLGVCPTCQGPITKFKIEPTFGPGVLERNYIPTQIGCATCRKPMGGHETTQHTVSRDDQNFDSMFAIKDPYGVVPTTTNLPQPGRQFS
jgi:predicted amidophosphoribosyltransferase